MRSLSDRSRSGVPTAPRKYLVVTMLVALIDQESGNSTPRCSKLIEPSRQLVITTSRRSQVTWSYGCTPAVVLIRRIFRPVRFGLFGEAALAFCPCPWACVVSLFAVSVIVPPSGTLVGLLPGP